MWLWLYIGGAIVAVVQFCLPGCETPPASRPLKPCKKSRAGFSILPKIESTDLVGIPGASLVLVFLESTHIPLPLAILPCAGLNGSPVCVVEVGPDRFAILV